MVGTRYVGSFNKSIYSVVSRSFTGDLSNFRVTQTGLDPNSSYFVGYMFDAGNSLRGTIYANDYVISDTHTAGTGSYRTSAGVARIWVGDAGTITWHGLGPATVKEKFKTFTVRVM